MALRGKVNDGLLYLLPEVLVRLTYLIPMMFLWRAVMVEGAASELTLPQLLTYTYLSALLTDLLAVETFASSWCYEGEIQKLFSRPASVFGGIIAETSGGWIPMLACFSLPMMLISPLFGVSPTPATLWFFPSLALCISLGFAVDMLFSCLAIALKGMAWLSYTIRRAAVSVFSGSVIPFKLLPFGLAGIFELGPLGSLGGAPLSLYVGSADPLKTISLQLFWNAALWGAALFFFSKSRERLVSYGG